MFQKVITIKCGTKTQIMIYQQTYWEYYIGFRKVNTRCRENLAGLQFKLIGLEQTKICC